MIKKILTYLCFVLLFLSFNSNVNLAQTVGLNFTAALPQGEFKDNVDNAGWGVSAHATLFTPGPTLPFTVGLNLGFINYGNESRKAPWSYTIPDANVDVTRTNNIVNFHVLFQVSPFNSPVKPYLEGLFGGNYLFTTTKVESDYLDKSLTETTNQDDFAWSYGGGGGIMIKLTDLADPVGSIWLDLKARYLLGTEAEYLKEGSVEINTTNGTAIYHLSRSKTDLLTIHIGVVAEF